jgi:hypothetical protein
VCARSSPLGGCTGQVILQPILPKSDRPLGHVSAVGELVGHIVEVALRARQHRYRAVAAPHAGGRYQFALVREGPARVGKSVAAAVAKVDGLVRRRRETLHEVQRARIARGGVGGRSGRLREGGTGDKQQGDAGGNGFVGDILWERCVNGALFRSNLL